MKITRETVRRALRTFAQTVIGYALANAAAYFVGIDYSDRSILKNACIGLGVAAVSAGAAAVMNLQKEDTYNE